MLESHRILVTGITSIHGWPIFRLLSASHPSKFLLGVRPPKAESPNAENVVSACLTDRRALENVRETFRPDVVLHAGGVCDLDVCEARPAWAADMNVGGARNVAELFGDCRVVYLSTDLVFSGEKTPPGGYSEQDTCDPVSVAGTTFLHAESEIARIGNSTIIRLGLPMGDSIQGTKGAVDWIEHRFRRDLPATLFVDEWRSAIDCEEVTRVVLALVRKNAAGLYHVGGPKRVSLYEMGELVLRRGGYDPTLLHASSRHAEVNGPPRIGDVSLNSTKAERAIGRRIQACRWWEPRAGPRKEMGTLTPQYRRRARSERSPSAS